MNELDHLDARNLRAYLEQIGRIPLAAEAEEHELGERAQRGDKEALRRLVEANLRFVVSYVKKYQGMGLSLLDLIHEGNLGLLEAARRFDPSRNVKFISYAVWWIRQAVLHALTQSTRITHVPQKLSDQVLAMKRKASALKAELGRDPAREEIAAAMGLSVEDIEDLEILAEREVSLNERFDEDAPRMEDRLSDDLEPPVESLIIQGALREQIRGLLDGLEEKEALVLRWRFGLDDDQPLTLQEIGARLSLTRERIRQIEQKAMRKLARSRTLRQMRGDLN